MREFKSQGLANTAWSYAIADYSELVLFTSLARAAEPEVGEFNAQGRRFHYAGWAISTRRVGEFNAQGRRVQSAGCVRGRVWACVCGSWAAVLIFFRILAWVVASIAHLASHVGQLVRWQVGFRSVRVGEASNPDP